MRKCTRFFIGEKAALLFLDSPFVSHHSSWIVSLEGKDICKASGILQAAAKVS